ncbi:thiamine phosphate synthase [Ammoniphilus sp. YIM 78166]|uniref:thiamine phosphate synthase n=1 Tax=Ammoniphilus sp. YIM 78166 TaxID=1644106 RepID=UPI00106FECCD|nr:thiamine phosphate synthase [Ammoniphilus sp. YIM 78166]
MPVPELHLISNGKLSLPQFADLVSGLHPHVQAIHLREKTKTAAELWAGVMDLLSRGIPPSKIYINDRADVAWASGIGGVQLAYHSLGSAETKRAFPTLRVGRSVHSVEEAVEMEERGADYLLYGHIFPTGSKPGLEARGLCALAEVAQRVTIPVIAIGGIGPEQVGAVLKAGASGIAVMSGIIDAMDPVSVTKQYREALLQGGNKHGIEL